jgi:hypothetical protein
VLALIAAPVIAFWVIPDVRADQMATPNTAIPAFWASVIICGGRVGHVRRHHGPRNADSPLFGDEPPCIVTRFGGAVGPTPHYFTGALALLLWKRLCCVLSIVAVLVKVVSGR